jgi:hypothetical protein
LRIERNGFPAEPIFLDFTLQFDHHGSQTVYDRRGFHPEIQELACRCFDHSAFSAETIGRLATWLGLEFPAARDVYGVPLREVAARLRSYAERMMPGNPPPPAATGGGERGTPPADPFAALRQFARGELRGQERAVIEALCDAGGELPIADLAAKDGVDWNNEFQGFKDVQRRLKPKLEKIGWALERHDNAGLLRDVRR